MTKTWMTALALTGMLCGTLPAWAQTTRDPRAFVLDKLDHNNLVFLGTTHRRPAILAFLRELVPSLCAHGVTHLALEITSDQQKVLQAYLDGRADLGEVKLHAALECAGYRDLLKKLRGLPPDRRPRVRAIDLPEAFYHLDLNRDQWMAARLGGILQKNKGAKVLAVLGSVHVLRTLPWQARILATHHSIRASLARRLPWLRAASIINIAADVEKNCDFAKAFGRGGAGVALDLDRRFDGWKLGPIQCMALRPAPARELVEGVIVH